jgi:hypothetical protein
MGDLRSLSQVFLQAAGLPRCQPRVPSIQLWVALHSPYPGRWPRAALARIRASSQRIGVDRTGALIGLRD